MATTAAEPIAPAEPAHVAADPLRAAEQAAFTFEVLSLLRHDLRNKLAPMRNVIAYVRRKVQGTELWEADPRIAKFLELMETEVTAASALMEDPPMLDGAFTRAARRMEVGEAIELAISTLRCPGRERIAVRSREVPASVEADPQELALALRGLLENALEADAGEIVLTVERSEGRVQITVADRGPGLASDAFTEAVEGRAARRPGRIGLSLKTASRIARRYGGELVLPPADAGTRIAIVLPGAAS